MKPRPNVGVHGASGLAATACSSVSPAAMRASTAARAPRIMATVGTDLDGRTTVTDAQGRFFLITDTPSMGGLTDYTITITSGAQTKDYGPFNWGDQPRGQVFDLD